MPGKNWKRRKRKAGVAEDVPGDLTGKGALLRRGVFFVFLTIQNLRNYDRMDIEYFNRIKLKWGECFEG